MITHIFDRVEIYCARHRGLSEKKHGHLQMVPIDGEKSEHTTYVCPRCFPYSEERPDGYGVSDTPCRNLIFFKDLIQIVDRLGDEMEKANLAGESVDYTGYWMIYQGIEAKVVFYDLDRIQIDILNSKEVGNVEE